MIEQIRDFLVVLGVFCWLVPLPTIGFLYLIGALR